MSGEQFTLNPYDIVRRPDLWRPISRTEACSKAWSSTIAVLRTPCGIPTADWFGPQSAFYLATGPYDFRNLRYFEYLGQPRAASKGPSGGSKRQAPEAASGDSELVPMEEKPEDIPTLSGPVWLGKEPQPDSTEPNDPVTSTMAGGAAWCRVDSTGLSTGDSIVFSIYKAGTEEKVETLSGRVVRSKDGDTAFVRFALGAKLIPKDKEEAEFEFKARQFAHKLEAKSPKLKVTPAKFEILLEIDVDNPASKDDEVILLDESNGEVMRVKIADMKEEGEDHVRLEFKGIDMKARYSLIRDHGPDEEGGQDALFTLRTPEEIVAMFSEPEPESEA